MEAGQSSLHSQHLKGGGEEKEGRRRTEGGKGEGGRRKGKGGKEGKEKVTQSSTATQLSSTKDRSSKGDRVELWTKYACNSQNFMGLTGSYDVSS